MAAPVTAHHKDQVFPFFFRGRIRFDYPGNHYPAGRKFELNYLSLVLPVIFSVTELHTDPNHRLVLTYLPLAPAAMTEPIVSQSRLGLFAGRLHCEKVLAPFRYLTLSERVFQTGSPATAMPQWRFGRRTQEPELIQTRNGTIESGIRTAAANGRIQRFFSPSSPLFPVRKSLRPTHLDRRRSNR